ncbi:MAG: hypothetical protein KAT77_05055 [Nanoarchaeota archaeon]|nr:hypothetical protein [Nanoarchaeota archaeon]
MRKIVLVLLVFIFLMGCGTDRVTVTSEEGDVTVEASGFDSDEWCQAGAQWKMSGSFDEGDTNAQWMIKGLVTSGEFAGLCHVEYSVETPDGQTEIDYYFSEDGESGYFEMDVNGQKFTQEWNG